MKIVFNVSNVGLGNNGGCRTVIKSAETLSDLGHEVYILASVNKYSWHKIRVPVVKIPPPCDVVVATGYHSVPSTLKFKKAKKFYYIRGFERWQATEADLIKSYRSLSCIVNSEWLCRYLRKQRIPCHLVYQGLDMDDFYITQDSREPILGGLFSTRHKTKRHIDVIKVGKLLQCRVLLLNRDIHNPPPEQLREFYNSVAVWMSPSELEGLHNPPMEAALCGCALVTTNHPQGGVSDYALHKKSALVYPAQDLSVAAKQVNSLLDDETLRKNLNQSARELLLAKIGTRMQNMEKMARIFKEVG